MRVVESQSGLGRVSSVWSQRGPVFESTDLDAWVGFVAYGWEYRDRVEHELAELAQAIGDVPVRSRSALGGDQQSPSFVSRFATAAAAVPDRLGQWMLSAGFQRSTTFEPTLLILTASHRTRRTPSEIPRWGWQCGR